MWMIPAATLFVLDPRRMKTPIERFKCLGSSIVNLISYVVLFWMIEKAVFVGVPYWSI